MLGLWVGVWSGVGAQIMINDKVRVRFRFGLRVRS